MTALTYDALQGCHGYWLLVAVDLSLRSKAKRWQAQIFKRFLMRDGLEIVQPSLYVRFCTSTEVCETHQSRVCKNAPELSKNDLHPIDRFAIQGNISQWQTCISAIPNKPRCDYIRLMGCHKGDNATLLQQSGNNSICSRNA